MITYVRAVMFSKANIVSKTNYIHRPLNSTVLTSYQSRNYSTPSRKPENFFSKFIDNVKDEIQRSKEMKENLKKFREEAEKLEQSEALKKARQKFHSVESEATKSSDIFKEKIEGLKGKVSGVIDDATKAEFAKKAEQLKEGFGKAAESISESGQKIGQTGAFQTISQTAQAVKKEIDQSTNVQVYRSPEKLRKRLEVETVDDRVFSPNTEATGVELHKDSRFSQSWQEFKQNNPYVHRVMDWKVKYDESNNPVVRASRLITEKVTDLVGGIFQKTELSETLTEICKIDPNFDKTEFLHQCQTDIIPNVLEAMIRGDLEILKDWCHDGPYNILSTPIKQAHLLGYQFCSKILDIDNLDLSMGKVMEQGPVLIISFLSQQILCMRDKAGKVVDGDPDKILRVTHLWVLCRDMNELNPRAAWKLLDMSAQSSEQLL